MSMTLEQEGVSFPSPHDRALSPTPGQQLPEQGLIDYLLSLWTSHMVSILVGPHWELNIPPQGYFVSFSEYSHVSCFLTNTHTRTYNFSWSVSSWAQVGLVWTIRLHLCVVYLPVWLSGLVCVCLCMCCMIVHACMIVCRMCTWM